MTLLHSNGNGSAIKPRTISGRGIAHRDLTKPQRAALAADVLSGRVVITLSAKQLSGLLNVSAPYIGAACKISPEQRDALRKGQPWSLTWFRGQLRRPAPKTISDLDLEQMIRAVGVDRALEVAAAIEA